LKRVEDAIRALATLSTASSAAELIVGGEDRRVDGRSERERLERLAQDLGIGGRVRFVGVVRDSSAFLDGIDVFLSCSDTEGLSNSIIEAMAAGKALIASAVGGTPELIESGVTGYLYPVRDIATLSCHLRRMVDDATQREKLGAAASEFANQRLGLSALLGAHEALYARLLSASRKT
jgi:L-malate glycosyltransferase